MVQVVSVRDDPKLALDAGSRSLRGGEAIAFPTETVYGLGVSRSGPDADHRLRRVKGRDERKPFQVLLSDAGEAKRLGAIVGCAAEALLEAFAPGPLTLVLPLPEGTFLGVRIPDHEFVRQLIRASGGALLATSANRPGQPEATSAAEIARLFGEDLALVLDDGPARLGVASTVVRVDDKVLTILREGSVSAAELSRVAELPAVFQES